MYTELKAKMAANGVTVEQIAEAIGKHRNTVAAKIGGRAKFYIDELIIIRDRFFPSALLDELAVHNAA